MCRSSNLSQLFNRVRPSKRRRQRERRNRRLLSGEPLEDRRVLATFADLPLIFEANYGQVDSQVDFSANAPGYGLYLTGESAVLSLEGSDNTFALHVNLVDANSNAEASGRNLLPGISNYFSADSEITNVPQYGSVHYDDVWPGIDAVYYGNQGQLEYDFVVEPGASPDTIQLDIAGADTVSIVDGELVIGTAAGDIVQQAPVIYQTTAEGRQSVDGSYKLLGDSRVGFGVGAYDLTQQLVIDPVLVYSALLGGSSTEAVTDIEVDAAGNVYATGATASGNFPTTPGVVDETINGGADVFVSKLSADGSTLLWSTYLGGNQTDEARDLVLDDAGNVIVVGRSQSANYPTTTGAFQTARSGSADGIVTKLDPSGSSLLYSTFVGQGGSSELFYGVDVDATGKIYVSGQYGFSGGGYPTTPGAFDTTPNGSTDGAFSIIDPAGNGSADLVYSTVLGTSSATEGIVDVQVDRASGDVYLVGSSRSSNFPNHYSIPGTAADPNYAGPREAWAARLSPDGNGTADMQWMTFVGGSDSGNDHPSDAELDASGNLVVVGFTNASNFPVTAGAYDTTLNGSADAWVAKVNPSGTAFLFSTFLGGSGQDVARELEIDANGGIWVAGETQSTNFPTVSPFQSSLSGVRDAFVAKLSDDGSTLEFSTYFGCSGNEQALGLAIDAAGLPIIAGLTTSTDFPATGGASVSGSQDGFIAKIDPNAPGTHTCGVAVNESPVLTVDSTMVTVDEGQVAANSGGVSDGDGDTVSLSATSGSVTNNNDGTWSWSLATDDGPADGTSVTIDGDDGNGGTDDVSFTLIVNNVAPDASISGPASALAGSAVSFTLGADDVSSADQAAGFTYNIDWDSDGNVDQTVSGADGLAVNHTFAAGTSTVTVTATDKDGGVSAAASTTIDVIQPIDVDVKPGNAHNKVNTKSQGVVPVAIYTTDDFNAATVDGSSVQLAGVSADHFALEDVDGDGDLDMILHFAVQDLLDALGLDLDNGDEESAVVELTGETDSGIDLLGSDTINFFRPGKGKGKK